MQTQFMFLGEIMSGFILLIEWIHMKAKKQTPEPCPEGKKAYKFFPHIFVFIVPAAFDFVQTLLYNIGMYYCLSSVHAMLKNLSIVFTALISFIAFKRYRQKFDLPHGIGLIVLLGGAFLVGALSIIYATGS